MKPEILRELVSRHTACEELSTAEKQALLSELQKSRRRETILADEAVDTLIRATFHIKATSEKFILETIARNEGANMVKPNDSSTPNRSPGRLPRVNGTFWFILASLAAGILICVTYWQVTTHRNDENWKDPGQFGQKKPEITKENPDETKHSSEKQKKQPQPDRNQENPVPDKSLEEKSRPVPKTNPPVLDNRFARLLKSENAVWETPIRDGDRLANGTLKLSKGTAELQFDRGTLAKMTGPMEMDLRNGNEVFLRRGLLAAQVPTEAVGFTVRTPVSRVVDRGSEFEIKVGETGETEAVVRQGKVDLTPQREGERAAKTLNLASGELERANVSLPDVNGKLLPLSTKAIGNMGRFTGLVSVDGKTGVFQNPESFQKFENAVIGQLRKSQEMFQRSWSVNVQVSGRGAMAYAVIVINGERYQIEVYGDDDPPNR